MYLPDSGHTLHCSDKALLVGGSGSGFPFFENKIGRASWTDLKLSNLYILQANFSTSFIFLLRLALPLSVRKESCVALGILSKLFEWLHMKEVVSQPVKASKGRRADTEPVGRLLVDSPDVEILSLCDCSRHHVQVRARDLGTCVTRHLYPLPIKLCCEGCCWRNELSDMYLLPLGSPLERQVDCSFWWL